MELGLVLFISKYEIRNILIMLNIINGVIIPIIIIFIIIFIVSNIECCQYIKTVIHELKISSYRSDLHIMYQFVITVCHITFICFLIQLLPPYLESPSPFFILSTCWPSFIRDIFFSAIKDSSSQPQSNGLHWISQLSHSLLWFPSAISSKNPRKMSVLTAVDNSITFRLSLIQFLLILSFSISS